MFRTSTLGYQNVLGDTSNFFSIVVFYPLEAIPSILAVGSPGPFLELGPSGEKVMKAISIGSKASGLLTGFAVLLFLAGPSLRAQDQPAERQDQPQVQEQPQIENQGPAQADSDATNMPAVDDNITDDESQNPPSRAARISFTDGSVSLQAGGTGDWGVAPKNRPVTIGDKLWVDKDSRAELQAGQIAIHLDGMTALSFLNLDQNVTQIRLPEGKINFRVREIRQGENYEVDTPNLAFTVKEAGAFRIDVNENGDFTSVTAIRGAGEIAASGQVYPVKAGERVDVTGTDGNVKVSTGAAPGPDTFDQWAQQRDIGEDNSPSAKYVNRDTVGYNDLDDYGTWKQDQTYGNVWVPNNEPSDWAPYSDGNWSYVAPWGWTWVGYEPWGFAPYHYGRWHYFGSYWGWSPGPIYSYPYYGPAYVGWLGGFGFGFGFGFGGGFGWFPLGWGEPFRPWYRCGRGYYYNVNVHNTYFHNFNGRAGAYHNWNYVYAHNGRAVTTASHNTFVNGERINRGAQHLNQTALRNAQVTNVIRATPTRASSLGASNMHGHVAVPSRNIENRSVMARSTPAAAAAHSDVRTMNTSGFGANRGLNSTVARSMPNANAPRGMSPSRQSELSAGRPPSATQPGRSGTTFNNSARPNYSNSGRTWNAQGNTTDSGRGPQGFGSSNRPSNSISAPRNSSTNRPPWAGTGNSSGVYQQRSSVNRPPTSYNGNRSYRGNGNRSYSPPSYNGNRGYSAPRTYNAPATRNYSAPRSYSPAPRSYSNAPRSYSAPSSPRSYSAPHSSGGSSGYHGGGSSGGGYHGGGGGGGHVGGGGGGGSHGGGGGHH
jgi:hypothetical protein